MVQYDNTDTKSGDRSEEKETVNDTDTNKQSNQPSPELLEMTNRRGFLQIAGLSTLLPGLAETAGARSRMTSQTKSSSPGEIQNLKEYIENPAMVGENQTESHVATIPRASIHSALAHDRQGDPLIERWNKSPYFTSLNGEWQFKWSLNPGIAPNNVNEVNDWDQIRVPSVWQTEGYGHPMYMTGQSGAGASVPNVSDALNPVGTYRRSFTVPRKWTNHRKTVLHFEGVKSAYFVWVNGEYVGYDQGSMTPGEFDVTEYIGSGTNSLTVKVFRWSDGSYFECFDMFRYSGIYRDVYLYSTPDIHLRDYFIQTNFDRKYEDATLQIDAEVKNDSEKPIGPCAFRATLFDPTGKKVKTLSESVTVDANNSEHVRLKEIVRSPDKWSDEHPNRYTIGFELTQDNSHQTEVQTTKVGFREFEIGDSQILVNGQPVEFRGTNLPETHPETGRTIPRKFIREDLNEMKQFNVNAIRNAHYPNDPEFYDIADEYGFYVCAEVNAETDPDWLTNDKTYRAGFMDRFTRMIQRHKNSASIFLWSTGNENGLGDSHFAMADYAQSVDPTRFLYAQGNKPHEGTAPYGPRYFSSGFLADIGKNEDETRPVVAGEYSHAMGNSEGDIAKVWDVIRQYDQLQGGFIWAWADQNLTRELVTTPDTSENGNDGALMGNPTVNKEDGTVGLSGMHDFIEFYRDPSLDIIDNELTVEAQIEPRNPWMGMNPILTKGDQYALYQPDADSIGFRINATVDLPTLVTPDLSSHGNTGTLVGNPSIGDGYSGRGVALNGKDQWVEVPNSPSLDITDTGLTLEVAVKPNESTDAPGPLLMKGNHAYALKLKSGGVIEFFLFDNGYTTVHVPYPDDWVGNWHHIAGTYDGSEMRVYLDGELAEKTAYDGAINSLDAPVEIGRNPESPANKTSATFDLARIYDRALSTGEIQNNAQTPANGAVMRLDFDTFNNSGNTRMTQKTITATAPIPDDWIGSSHRLSGVVASSEISLYLDGTRVATADPGGEISRITHHDSPVYLGLNNDPSSTFYQPRISNSIFHSAHIYSRSLSDNELAHDRSTPDSSASLWLDFESVEHGSDFEFYGVSPFCLNGLTLGDRTPQPELYAVKQAMQPVEFTAEDLANGTVKVENRYAFTNLRDRTVTWSLQADGQVVQQGRLGLDIAPGESASITIPYEKPDLRPGSEYWLTLSVMNTDSSWVNNAHGHGSKHNPGHEHETEAYGHEIAFEQFEVPFSVPTPISVSVDGTLSIANDSNAVNISGKTFEYAFDKNTGAVSSLTYNGTELFTEGPQFDVGSTDFEHTVSDVHVESVEKGVTRVKMSSMASLSDTDAGFDLDRLYHVLATGDILMGIQATPNEAYLSDNRYVPRLGLHASVNGRLNKFSWYGRGPTSTYPDRTGGTAVSTYSSSVSDQFVPYLPPSEFGNKTGTRWATLSNGNGIGLAVFGHPNVNVRAHDVANYERALYEFQIDRTEDTQLDVNPVVGNLGTQWSYPSTLSYHLSGDPVEFLVGFRPFDGSTDIGKLSRRRFPYNLVPSDLTGM